MTVIDDYFDAKQAIFDACGYVEVWRDCPLSDMRNHYWHVTQHTLLWVDEEGEKGLEDMRWCMAYEGVIDDEDSEEDEEPNWYSAEIYSGGSKGVFRGPDFILVRADTNTDGNINVFILDPELEVVVHDYRAILRKDL